ncbi:phage integrase family protein with SAM-like domain [Cytobacillus firmus]|uniref:Phage integrase family protein with SAM-like domain n=2 Tax=Cytobacillus TaxID=2675230 RepID=A0A366JM73_CYTFI|nr:MULTISPECIES: site-specific integrase [Cytobacillus]RBP88977.1 phage integrase family protein with SAM-like domain [Cytobacillus firmus]TDX47170.1 phage integrase family protein with SAM-like domain [Cytobacillus oceanisediminis]
MKLQWLPIDVYKKTVHDAEYLFGPLFFRESILMAKKLIKECPEPIEWLDNPIRFKSANTGQKETNYIINWAIHYRLFQDDFIRPKLLKYFASIQINKVLINWAIFHNILNEMELAKISEYSKATRHPLQKYLPIHLLWRNMKLEELVNADIEKDCAYFQSIHKSKYSPKLIQQLLFDLDYSDKKSVAKRTKRKNIEFLKQHPVYGRVMDDYESFLKANGTKSVTINNIFKCIKKFIDYVDTQGFKDISYFEAIDLERYIEYLESDGLKASSINAAIPSLLSFLEWAAGAYEMFPNQIEFPKQTLKRIRKQAERIREEEDGLAFENEDTPKAIVSFLLNFEPRNELEFLCKYFWILTSSCPVRQKFTLSLEANNCIYPMLNEKSLFGLYSQDADKAGNTNGQFPIIDENGVSTVRILENRINNGNFKPVYNENFNRSFIHLFQFENSSKVLTKTNIVDFLYQVIKPAISVTLGVPSEEIKAGTHSFRHYLLTHIIRKTGSEEAAQAAAGHHDKKMLRKAYIVSKHGKNALLLRALDKYETGEITGKFYLRLIELLTSNNPDTDMMRDLTSNMELHEFISRHGRSTEMGYCFDENQTCNHYLKCWNCPSFMLCKEDISGAIDLLRRLILEFHEMVENSKNFSLDNTISRNKLTAISMIKERLGDLKYTDKQIEEMVFSPN